MSHPPKRAQEGHPNAAEPHPARVQAGRTFFADRLIDPDPSIAILNIAVTASGTVHAHAIGMDVVHARIALAEIDRIRPILADHIHQEHSAKIIPIRAGLQYT
jgi:hypothetical protein